MKELIRALMGRGEGEPLPSLSPTEMTILRMLVVREMYGQELVTESDGALKRGTVYVTLQRMEEKGFVTSSTEERPQSEGGLPRRRYRVAGEGARTLAAYDRLAAFAAGGRLA